MSKHTPGPWYYDFASGMKNGSPQVVEYFVRRDGDDVSIAADIVDPEKCVPSEANARLIAAAPDLLEALEASLEKMKNDWITLDGEFGPFMQEFGDIKNAIKEEHASTKTIRMAIAAIARAKGEV